MYQASISRFPVVTAFKKNLYVHTKIKEILRKNISIVVRMPDINDTTYIAVQDNVSKLISPTKAGRTICSSGMRIIKPATNHSVAEGSNDALFPYGIPKNIIYSILHTTHTVNS